MKLYIPAVGDKIKLTADWQFKLYFEGRNDGLLKVIAPNEFVDGWPNRFLPAQPRQRAQYRYVLATLPVGSVLRIARVYVRAFNVSAKSIETDYDSITFTLQSSPLNLKTKPRFWTKLQEVNEIEYEKHTE